MTYFLIVKNSNSDRLYRNYCLLNIFQRNKLKKVFMKKLSTFFFVIAMHTVYTMDDQPKIDSFGKNDYESMKHQQKIIDYIGKSNYELYTNKSVPSGDLICYHSRSGKIWIRANIVDDRFYVSDDKGFGDFVTEQGVSSVSFTIFKDNKFTVSKEELLLLCKIFKGSNNACSSLYRRFFQNECSIKKDDIPQLKSIMQKVKTYSYTDSFEELCITTDLTPVTVCEHVRTVVGKVQDTVFYHGPLLLCAGAPHMILHKEPGITKGFFGFIACAIGGFIMGNYLYPVLDSYNSGVYKLSQWFGDKNHKLIQRGMRFSTDIMKHFIVSTLFYIASEISYQLIDCKEVASIICYKVCFLLQALSFLLQFAVYCQSCSHLENYSNPFNRSSAKKRYFTLGDLLEGPIYKNH